MAIDTDLKKIQKLSLEKKALLIIIFILIFVLGIYFSFGVNLLTTLQQSPVYKNLVTEPTQTPLPETVYQLTTTQQILKVGTPVTIEVNLSGTPVQVSDVAIIFDAEVFKIGEVKNGDVYDKLFKVDKNLDGGKSRPGFLFVAASVSGQNPTFKTGKIFSFTLTPIKTAEDTQVSFDIKRSTASLQGNNTLKSNLKTLSFSVNK